MKRGVYLGICFVLAFGVFLTCAARQVFVPQVFAGISDTGVDTDNGETLTTNPKTRTTSVSATVRDTIAPTVPILVTPDNSSSISTNMITFTWKSSSDDHGINRYIFYIDGSVVFDDIPPTAKISPLKYDYSEKDGVSTLVMKYALADGAHTWKVRAFDNNENYADSATWSFTVDTSAPILLISTVGDATTSISAQDASTIPADPLVLYVNSPTISGKTEASAKVTLSYLVPSNATVTLSTTADSLGNYSFTLPSLPLKVIISFQVVAKDGVGNTTMIDNVRFKIIHKTLSFPSPIKEIIPEIPIIPPEEMRQGILKHMRPYVPEPIVDIVDTVSPLTNSAIGLMIPLARLLAALWLIGTPVWNWSLRTVLRTANAVGIWPSGGLSSGGWPTFWLPPIPHHAQGIVFDLDTQKPIPFALITALRLDPEGPTAVDQRVSNKDGTYETLCLPSAGSYILVPTHHDYTFDPLTVIKRFSGMQEVYKGETISKERCGVQPQTLDSTPLESIDEGIECTQNVIFAHLYIPMARIQRSMKERLALTTATLPDNGLAFSTVMMAVIAFLSPSPWNIGVLVLYSFAMVKRLIVT